MSDWNELMTIVWHEPSDRRKHARHERVTRSRTNGHFAGKRLRTEIERCRTCKGLLLSIHQVEDRRPRNT